MRRGGSASCGISIRSGRMPAADRRGSPGHARIISFRLWLRWRSARREHLNVGDDYSTPDGTGVRDYIHVVDLALGHLKALDALALGPAGECLTVNLGTGNGYSVLEIVRAFEKASGQAVPYKVAPRRPGDVASCYADPGYALKSLGWRAARGLDEMCADAWRWQHHNPNGYAAEVRLLMVNRRINFRMQAGQLIGVCSPVVRPLCAGLVMGSMLFVTEAQANHQGTPPTRRPRMLPL